MPSVGLQERKIAALVGAKNLPRIKVRVTPRRDLRRLLCLSRPALELGGVD
jgi:hypothetical protein